MVLYTLIIHKREQLNCAHFCGFSNCLCYIHYPYVTSANCFFKAKLIRYIRLETTTKIQTVSERVLNTVKRLSRCSSGLCVPLESQWSLVRFPAETYFHFWLFFFPFFTTRRSPCKWNQAWPFSFSHCCYRPQIRLIIQDYKYTILK